MLGVVPIYFLFRDRRDEFKSQARLWAERAKAHLCTALQQLLERRTEACLAALGRVRVFATLQHSIAALELHLGKATSTSAVQAREQFETALGNARLAIERFSQIIEACTPAIATPAPSRAIEAQSSTNAPIAAKADAAQAATSGATAEKVSSAPLVDVGDDGDALPTVDDN